MDDKSANSSRGRGSNGKNGENRANYIYQNHLQQFEKDDILPYKLMNNINKRMIGNKNLRN